MKYKVGLVLSSLLSIAVLTPVPASDYLITGSTPSQRLYQAPVIEWVQHNRSWYEKGLTGVSQPYPPSLYFLDNQGNWYTPFIHRGMASPYDLRGWYQ